MSSTLRRAASESHRRGDHLVILLPDPRILRLIARSVLLFAALLFFPWIRTLPQFRNGPSSSQLNFPKWVDNPFLLPMLIADLKREGLFGAQCRALFLGDPSSRAGFLKKNRIDAVLEYRKLMMVEDGSVDFVLAADGVRDSSLFGLVDRVLKVGGIVTVRLGSNANANANPAGSSSLFHLPGNYIVAYIRRFGSTVVAVKKISHGNVGDFRGRLTGRRLLLVDEEKVKLEKKAVYLILNEVTDENMENSDWSKREQATKENEFEKSRNVKIGVARLKRTVYLNKLTDEKMENSDWSKREQAMKENEFDQVKNVKIGVVSLVDGGSVWALL